MISNYLSEVKLIYNQTNSLAITFYIITYMTIFGLSSLNKTAEMSPYSVNYMTSMKLIPEHNVKFLHKASFI